MRYRDTGQNLQHLACLGDISGTFGDMCQLSQGVGVLKCKIGYCYTWFPPRHPFMLFFQRLLLPALVLLPSSLTLLMMLLVPLCPFLHYALRFFQIPGQGSALSFPNSIKQTFVLGNHTCFTVGTNFAPRYSGNMTCLLFGTMGTRVVDATST